MSAKHLLLTITAFAVIILMPGCDSTVHANLDTSDLDLALAPASVPGPGARPFRGSCETTYVQLGPPPVFEQLDTGPCQLAHLGRAMFSSLKEINFLTGTQITTDASFTAANGDVLLATGSGTSALIAPGRVQFFATLDLNGGTGRFAGATGVAIIEGEANLATATAFQKIVDGWILYDASNR